MPPIGAPQVGQQPLGGVQPPSRALQPPISATLPSNRNRFSQEVLPLISSIHDSDRLDHHSAAMSQLINLVKSTEVRAAIWEHVGAYGVPHNLSQTQRQALSVSMMPYVATDNERSWNALLNIADRAVASSDMPTYELVGKTALSVPLPNEMIECFAHLFVKYETHNASQVVGLSPWITLFSERASENTCDIFVCNIMRRLGRGQFSTYDHTLTVLCQAQNPIALQMLHETASPPVFHKRYGEPPVDILAVCTLCEMPVMLPLAAMVAYTLGGFASVVSGYTVVLAGALATLRTLWVHRPRLKEIALEKRDQTLSFLEGSCFGHYVDHLFDKLCSLSTEREAVSDVLDAMEQNPYFAPKHAEWRERRSGSIN